METGARRALLVGTALAAVVAGGHLALASVWDEAGTRRSVELAARELRAGGEAERAPTPEDLAAARGTRDELQARLDALLPRLSYALPEAFDVPPGKTPDLRYIEILRREQALLVDQARYVGRSVPSNLGMPDLNPTGLEDVLRTLRSLHVVHLVVSAALASGVASVDAIEVPPARRQSRGESGFLRSHPVSFEMRGSPAAVRDVLAGLVAGTPALLVDDLVLEAVDDEGEAVKARFSAAAVVIDGEQPVLDPVLHERQG